MPLKVDVLHRGRMHNLERTSMANFCLIKALDLFDRHSKVVTHVN